MSVEGLLGTDDVFADDLHALRPHPGQAASASNLRKIMAGSEIRESHRTVACTGSRMRIRCAAPRRWPEPCATPSIMPSGWP